LVYYAKPETKYSLLESYSLCRDLIQREENTYNLRPDYLKKFKPVEVKVRKVYVPLVLKG
jgi:hypothetical protein